ncbi:hypothetical protein GGR56DRAFT_686070 [Xylariaceae sp. FL0804]|nr:hypothetical protein GGR56DRAFT_686070 [Xylariaceae sp. FL0804]
MKVNAILAIAATQTGLALATAAAGAVEVTTTTCGDLKVMDASAALPVGVDAADVRACLEHPLHNAHVDMSVGLSSDDDDEMSDIGARSADSGAGVLEPRACYRGPKKYGCDGGYCWKKCGSKKGPWCWTATNQGFGDWITCSKHSDCGTKAACGESVGGDCDSCGCSC